MTVSPVVHLNDPGWGWEWEAFHTELGVAGVWGLTLLKGPEALLT